VASYQFGKSAIFDDQLLISHDRIISIESIKQFP